MLTSLLSVLGTCHTPSPPPQSGIRTLLQKPSDFEYDFFFYFQTSFCFCFLIPETGRAVEFCLLQQRVLGRTVSSRMWTEDPAAVARVDSYAGYMNRKGREMKREMWKSGMFGPNPANMAGPLTVL